MVKDKDDKAERAIMGQRPCYIVVMLARGEGCTHGFDEARDVGLESGVAGRERQSAAAAATIVMVIA